VKRSQVYGDADPKAVLDEAKMKAALAKAVQWQQQEAGAEASSGNGSGGVMPSSAAGKRGYNSMAAVDVTPEDMEVWRLKRLKESDPAAAWDGETLLEYEKKK